MPAGQLDGGRIVQSDYGRRVASWTTVLTLIFLVIATVINPLALYWGGIVLILLRDLERPMLNELSELDGDREALGVVALFWMVPVEDLGIMILLIDQHQSPHLLVELIGNR